MYNKGFSLIELSIGLIVAGLVIVPIMNNKKVERKIEIGSQSLTQSAAKIDNVKGALDDYFFQNGRYPCPANITLNDDHEDYGKEVTCTLNEDIDRCSEGQNGVCRTTDLIDSIVIGSVPFVDLKISPDDALDMKNRRLTYAVTRIMTNADSFDALNGRGTITIKVSEPDENNNEVSTSAHYLVLSHGQMAMGSYLRDGSIQSACIGDDDSYEFENCDNDSIFYVDDIEGFSTPQSDVPGDTFFDDISTYRTSIDAKIWFTSPNDNAVSMTLAERIGIGTSAPQEKLHVAGTIRTNQNVHTEQVCDEIGIDCFNPETLTGNNPSMRCNALSGNNAIIGIAQEAVNCGLFFDTTLIPSGECDKLTGELMVGFDSDGEIKCAVPQTQIDP